VAPCRVDGRARQVQYLRCCGTPALACEESRRLLKGMRTDTTMGLREGTLVALMIYSFVRLCGSSEIHLGTAMLSGAVTTSKP